MTISTYIIFNLESGINVDHYHIILLAIEKQNPLRNGCLSGKILQKTIKCTLLVSQMYSNAHC